MLGLDTVLKFPKIFDAIDKICFFGYIKKLIDIILKNVGLVEISSNIAQSSLFNIFNI